jgi:5-deoxy-glucuronate isomerase
VRGPSHGLAPGYTPLLAADSDPEVGLDFGVHLLGPGETLRLESGGEIALLVLRGRGVLELDGERLAFDRPGWIETGPTALHAPAGASISVEASAACEVARVGTENPRRFSPRLFDPASVPTEHRGRGLLDDMSYRLVRTVFDASSAPPEARLVLGEVVCPPGRWSSYPPHHHPQPEIYYYRFHPERGYGHGELGEEVHLLREHDVLRITGSRDHAQAAAPGYHMYYLWAIRHLEGNPYRGFEYNPDHRRLLEGPEAEAAPAGIGRGPRGAAAQEEEKK